MSDLKGKNIIVTGASGGIGNSIIEKLNQAGANILASGTKIEKLDVLKSKFENIKILKFDISQSDKIEEFIENATKELGGNLDCIINNAGVTQDNLAIRMTINEWKKVIRLAEEHLERKPPASKRISSGSWTTPFPCPVCGRAEHLVCQQSSDGDCVRCFVGNSYAPPEGLRKGQVILDGWAFSRLQFVGWGEFAIFVKHKTPPLQKLRRFYP